MDFEAAPAFCDIFDHEKIFSAFYGPDAPTGSEEYISQLAAYLPKMWPK
jgi:hypothetical protein